VIRPGGRERRLVGEPVEQRRLPGVGVARERHEVEPLLAPTVPQLLGGVGEFVELAFEPVDPVLGVV
jgi:hypothetical protein